MDVCGNGAALSDGQEEFFPEGGDDANLEWLSMLVEDCLSAAPGYSATTQHRPPPAAAPTYAAITQHRPPPAAASVVSLPVPLQPSLLPETRGKRKLPAPPLLQQRYWPADSELILQHVSMSKKATHFVSRDNGEIILNQVSTNTLKKATHFVSRDNGEIILNQVSTNTLKKATHFVSRDNGEIILNQVSTNTHKKATHFVSGDEEMGKGEVQQSRRCTHCQAQKTPQWRTGPMGPKSLCNACGVRFKSGRLLPEYRPAKSPTFVSYHHSNSHKKVMEMRMRSSKESNSH